MAITPFKQSCPSCEALVPIRDAALIGKKIECPKCKYRFVVEAPADAKKKGRGDDDEDGKGKNGIVDKSAKKGVTAGKPKAAPTKKKRAADEDDEAEDVDL